MGTATAFDLEAYWGAWRAEVDAELLRAVDATDPALLWESMRYSLAAGGKRLRPLLTLATLDALGVDPRPALPAACALELIHTQSLIHDDLPAMDDDDLRRGRPTNHKVFGEAQAILAGDALMALPFRLLARELAGRFPPAACLAACEELATATLAMIGGQTLDIASEGQAVSRETLRFIHANKTGALILASVRLGGILGDADPRRRADLDAYGRALGLAFQIADDILDVTQTAEALGKTPGKDQAAGKATYVSLYGLETARIRLAEAVAAATAALAAWPPSAEPLRALAAFVARQVD